MSDEQEKALAIAARYLTSPANASEDILILAREVIRAKDQIDKLSMAVYAKRL